jgi:PBP1b-binding outer membrane lipoprotein LpoB
MKLILTIALSALMLSGCVAQWPSDRKDTRYHQGPLILPMSTPSP